MQMFLIVLGFMLVLVAVMAIGVILGRKPISGSCGGMSALGMDVACDICKGDKSKCDTENGIDPNNQKNQQSQAQDLGHDAMQHTKS